MSRERPCLRGDQPRPGPQRRLPAAQLLSLVALALAGRHQGGVPRPGEHRLRLRARSCAPSFAMRAAQRRVAQDLRQARSAAGLHAVQRVPARPLPCQYCGVPHDLTFDHVVPRSRGGRTTWENVVTACAPCNLRKGGRSPREAKMWPSQQPYRPSVADLQNNGRPFRRTICTKAGWTISTGTSNWSRELSLRFARWKAPPHPVSLSSLRSPSETASSTKGEGEWAGIVPASLHRR